MIRRSICSGAIRSIFLVLVFLGIFAGAGELRAQSASVPASSRAGDARVTATRRTGSASLVSNLRVIGDRTIRLEYSFDTPARWSQGGGRTPAGLDRYSVPGITIPGFTKDLAAHASSVSIESVDVVEVPVQNPPLAAMADVPLSGNRQTDAKNAAALALFHPTTLYPGNWAEVRFGGVVGESPVSTLVIHPYRYDPVKKVILWARGIVLRVEADAPVSAATVENASSVYTASNRRSGVKSSGSLHAAAVDPTLAPDGYRYALYTQSDGVFRVRVHDLVQLGMPVSTIDARTLKLYHNGVEVPIYLFDRGDDHLDDDPLNNEYLEFFGERKRADSGSAGSDLYYDPYTYYSAYFLTWGGGAGRRIVEESGDIRVKDTARVVDLTSQTASFPSTLHFEENLLSSGYAPLNNVGLNNYSDRFDQGMWKVIPASGIGTFSLDVRDPNPLKSEPVRLVAAVRGSSSTGPYRDIALSAVHRFSIYVQSKLTLDTSFIGQRALMATNDGAQKQRLTSADLSSPDGKATINVVNSIPDTGSAGESFFVNWFELTYQRYFKAANNQLAFTPTPGFGPSYYNFAIRGFTSANVRVYRDGISRITNFPIMRETSVNSRDTNVYDALLQVFAASEKEHFTILTEDQITAPLMRRMRSQNLKSPDNDYNYVVIVDDSTSNFSGLDDPKHPLNRFAAFKEAGGYHVKIVRISDIYDEFGAGQVSPWAIREFFRYAYHSWRRPLQYALIFSSGLPTKDPLDFGEERSHVPSILFQTIDFGETPCDYLLGCLDGQTVIRQNSGDSAVNQTFPDFFPEVIVGRVPTSSIAQIDAYVSKLINQESAHDYGEWRNHTGFIAGRDAEFSSAVTRFINDEFRYSSEPSRILTGTEFAGSAYGDPGQLLPMLNDKGVGLVTYLGHGGGGQWEETFSVSSTTVYTVKNENRMPAIFSLTCFTGTYTPDDGLLSAFMVQPRGGAIIGLGTPGFGWLLNNTYLAESIFSVLENPRYRDINFGQLIALGKARYIGNYQSQYEDNVPTLAAMFSIFGDPTLHVPITLDTVELVPTGQTSAAPGANVGIAATLPFTPTSVIATLFDTTETEIAGSRVTISPSANVSVSRSVPAGYAQSYVGIRIYAHDDAGHSSTGTYRFPTAQAAIVAVKPVGTLTVGQDGFFDIELARELSIDHMLISLQHGGTVDYTKRSYPVTGSGNGRFRTSTAVAGSDIKPGAFITVEVPVGAVATGDSVFVFYVPGGPEPAARAIAAIDSTGPIYGRPADVMESYANESIGMAAAADGPRLSAMVYNWGDRPAQAVPYRIYYLDSAGKKSVLLSGTVSVPARDSVLIQEKIPAQLPVKRDVTLELLPTAGEPVQDVLSTNNRAFHTVSLSAGAFTAGSGFIGDPIASTSFTIRSIGRMTLSGAATMSGVVTATADPVLPVTGQRWQFVTLGDSTLHGATLTLHADSAQAAAMLGSLTLAVDRRQAGFGKQLGIVRYDRITRLWTAFETTRSSDSMEVTATVPIDGIYSIAVVEDKTGPEVRFSVDGQFYGDGTVVPPKPKFNVVVSDPSGIVNDPSKIVVTLDDRTLRANQEYVVVDTTMTPTTMNIRIQPDLAAGPHKLCVQATDRAGNTVNVCTSFSVEAGLSVKIYGNYPNPFESETFLAYEIRGASVVDAVELKLYTTAGKLIRTMRSPSTNPLEEAPMMKGGTGQPTALGYHEAWWDGTDVDGMQVANGVYFYKLRVTLKDDVIENTGTIARIR